VHDKGSPPPSMSSKEGMPVDVRSVEDDDGHGRVPDGKFACLELIFRLNEDMDDVRSLSSCRVTAT
jgi:hypothetical protein